MKRLLIILQISFILILPVNSMNSIVNATTIDATGFNPLPITVEAQASSGVPIGTVIAWPSHTSPPDASSWLDCNGQGISRSTYPELYAIIGSRVPNYQGMFLRGYGGQSYAQNNGTNVGASNTYHYSGGLNQVQGDAIRTIAGAFGNLPAQSTGFTRNASGAFYEFGGYLAQRLGNQNVNTLAQTAMGFNSSRAVPTASEIRPVNMAVRYLIRAR